MFDIDVLKKLIQRDFNRLKPNNLYSFKKKWAKEYGKLPKDSTVLDVYRDLLAEEKVNKNLEMEDKLMIRRVRSISGVTPFAVMTKPFPCPGSCSYCPSENDMPKSYLSDEPAAQRALKFKFDPRRQVENRLQQLVNTGHNPDKIEIIVIGGTFSNYPEEYKRSFFKGIFDAINGVESGSLEEAQLINESADRKVVGMSVETRPDWIDEGEVKLLRELGVTKIQMGAQAFDNEILDNVNRGHGVEETAKATRLLKNSGIKVSYHFMPNLPGSNPEKDLEMARIMYEDPRFKPDFVKIYPVQVIPGTKLYEQWKSGDFKTYNDEILQKLLKEIKLITPPWVRIDRLVRDISKKWISSGTEKSNMRQLIQNELEEEGESCKCIRCREIRDKKYSGTPDLNIRKIYTEGGKELFMTYEDDKGLYSLLRLRLVDKNENVLFDELKNSAIIRELHTFGEAVSIDHKVKEKSQHQGMGQKLIESAENEAREAGYNKIAVISAIGTRNYYRKFGYEREGLYMTKLLSE